MNVTETRLPGVLIVEPKIFGDKRGCFFESYNKKTMEQAGIKEDFVQDNQSRSTKGVLRGLHYQIKQPQGKFVRVLVGEIFDVAVDIRKRSPTFGQWVGESLSAENKKMIWVPPRFAHGFLVLSDIAEVLYKTTDYYAPEHERCILWNDPDIGIIWPTELEPVLSVKDKNGISISQAEIFK